MNKRIEPALSAEEWREYETHNDGAWLSIGLMPGTIEVGEGLAPSAVAEFSAAKAIAIANDTLPGNDPRKITREMVKLIRHGAAAIRETRYEGLKLSAVKGYQVADRNAADALLQFAHALESYLPPES